MFVIIFSFSCGFIIFTFLSRMNFKDLLVLKANKAPGLLLADGIKAAKENNYTRAQKLLSDYLNIKPQSYKAKLALLDVYQKSNQLSLAHNLAQK